MMKVFHFNNGTGGGVLTVIKNLIGFSQNPAIENHVIYTIEKRSKPTIIDFPGASSVQTFYYDRNWNFYHTCKEVKKLIPDEKAILVAHDWLELGMVSQLGMQNPVVQFLHGDFEYYYQLAKKHRRNVDKFICVSSIIERHLKGLLSGRLQDIQYCRFPVPPGRLMRNRQESALKLIYCVRSLNEIRKQFDILPEIQKRLIERGTEVKWTIVGDGKTEDEIKALFGKSANYFSALPNGKVLEEMSKNDLFLLPSLQEGFPVVVVEAMKSGLVPLISHWEGAVDDLIIEGKTGFKFEIGDVGGYADAIISLDKNRDELAQISEKGIAYSNRLFDPYRNTEKVEDCYAGLMNSDFDKKTFKAYGSRLDQRWIPNKFVTWLRGALNLF